MAQEYIMPEIMKGDTFDDLQFTIKINDVVEDLTGYAIECKFRRNNKRGTVSKTLTVGSGITVTDATNGVFKIDSFDLDWHAGVYFYDIEFTDTNDLINTYICGTLTVVQDVTYT